MQKIVAVALLVALGAAHAATAEAPPRPAKVLVVLRVIERPNHIFVPGMSDADGAHPRVPYEGDLGKSYVQLIASRAASLNEQFITATRGLDRDAAMAAAMAAAFRERSPVFEITTSADRDRYMTGGLSAKPTRAARSEGFDYVLALFEKFVGLATINPVDAENGLLTPGFDLAYSLHDLQAGKVLARGKVYADGFIREPFDTAVKNRESFAAQWPYLCATNAVTITDELLRNDTLHGMAERVGRGAEVPAVARKLADYRKRLRWDLKPATGWSEFRVDPLTRILKPRSNLSETVLIRVDADLLLAELGRGVTSVEEYLPIYDRQRQLHMPLAKPLAPFTDIDATGYRAYRFTGPAGETHLVFMRTANDGLMQVVTATFAGTFDSVYPPLRPKLEEMLAHSVVRLN